MVARACFDSALAKARRDTTSLFGGRACGQLSDVSNCPPFVSLFQEEVGQGTWGPIDEISLSQDPAGLDSLESLEISGTCGTAGRVGADTALTSTPVDPRTTHQVPCTVLYVLKEQVCNCISGARLKWSVLFVFETALQKPEAFKCSGSLVWSHLKAGV